jgi:Tfp pilus assembly protein PilX
MKKGNRFLRGQQGLVLVNSLALLSVLMVAGIGAGVMLQNDFRVLSNLRGGTEAFYIGVAGVEWAKSEIARATGFPPLPPSQSRSFSRGQFVVTFPASTVAGPLAARVVVHSTGISHGAESALQVQLTKSYDLADAAVVLRGNGAQISLNADAIFISGADHDTAGNATGKKSRSSVSAADDSMRALVLQALGTPPRQGVLYEGADTPATTTSSYLPGSVITQLANGLCASPMASVHTIPSAGGLTIENQSMGDLAGPQVHCVEGLPASGDAATMAGSVSGAGILVVKNADLVLSGTFRWVGLVLVTGSDVSLRSSGAGAKELLGAAVVHEEGIAVAGRKLLDFEGAIRILFSRLALSQASSLVPTASANIARGSLPSMISQDYWRSVTQ